MKGSCEHRRESSDSIKVGEFLGPLNGYQFDEISGFHGGECEYDSLLGCCAV
jgi:hypothetical protein